MTGPDGCVQRDIDAYWSQRSSSYDAYQQQPARLADDRAAWSSIFAAVLPPAPARVLDVGCGSGYVATLLADLGHDVTAVDHSHGMLALARERAAARTNPPRVEFGDAVAPPGEPGAYDAITNRYLMWTLREPATALDAWRRLLRPGGVLAVVDSTWFAHGPVRSDQPFGRHYGPDVWSALPLAGAASIEATADTIAAAGFADVVVTPLRTIYELDQRYGVAPDHEVQLQFLVTAHG